MKKINITLGFEDPKHVKKMHEQTRCLCCGSSRLTELHHLLLGRYALSIKNSDHMTIILCKKCHDKLHAGSKTFFFEFFNEKIVGDIRDFNNVIRYSILEQAILIFALECVNMTTKQITEAYYSYINNHRDILKNREYEENLLLDKKKLISLVNKSK